MPVTNEQHPTFEDLEILVEVSKLLTLHDLNTVMHNVIDLAAKAVNASKASLFLHDGVQVDWDFILTARPLDAQDSVRVVSRVLDEGLAGWVVRNRLPAVIPDTETDERWVVFPDDKNPARSVMCVPMMTDDQVVAVITLIHPDVGHFTDYHLRLMTIIANQATVAIRNAQLFRRLQQEQNQLQAVLRSAPNVMIVTDRSGVIINVNEGALAFMGVQQPASMIGKTLSAFEQHANLLEQIINAMGGDWSANQDITLEGRSTDNGRDYVMTISTWAEESADSGGYVIAMNDVTTLRDLYRFKDEILHIVSHDLRSPLSIISGYADMLELDIAPESHLNDYLSAIRRSVTRMSDLLEDLLQVRQIDDKGLNIEHDTVLMDLTQPILQMVAMLTEQKHQTVVNEVQLTLDDTGSVDPALLRQAMENLATNAVKYTPEGGQITIRARVDDNHLIYEVKDNGIGIPEDSIPHLFESFYRVNPKENATISGAGLGLSLVKSIVERHQGKIWVESVEGAGSLFGISIPLSP